ncbi:MAG: methionyl-tRNA formyltransferase [bacterium]|nr:methionyl-tRNA formyltransferase [bacterium]
MVEKEEVPKLVFFGTSGICLPFLERLHDAYDIPLIVTQPDAVGGRKRKLIVPAVKTFALEHNIEVIQPETLKDDAIKEKIGGIEPVLGVVIAYGKLIPKRIFRVPEFRTVNVHFSKLPMYRGAAPVQRALENGDERSATTIFEIVKKLDAGAIWAQKEMDILREDTTETLWQRMSEEGAGFLCDTVEGIINGSLTKVPQDHEKATLAPPIEKSEGRADWGLSAERLVNRLKAFTPWPGLCCYAVEKQFKLTRIKVSELVHEREPGDVLGMDKTSLRVCCGEGSVLEILEFQPQGKKPMTPYQYCMGNELPDRLV